MDTLLQHTSEARSTGGFKKLYVNGSKFQQEPLNEKVQIKTVGSCIFFSGKLMCAHPHIKHRHVLDKASIHVYSVHYILL